MSPVSAIRAAASDAAVAHYSASLAFETDCSDVHSALAGSLSGDPQVLAQATDFVLLDVRSPALFARGHVPGAVNLPHGKIVESRMREFADGTLFVVYCAGPH